MYKYLILLIFIALEATQINRSYAQEPATPLTSATGAAKVDGKLYVNGAFYVPVGVDTPGVSDIFRPKRSGALFLRQTGLDTTLYLFYMGKGWGKLKADPPNLSGYELLSNKSTTTTLGTSNTLYPTQNAVKVYVDGIAVTKQATLVSGTNIKTINSNSLLGSGDLVVGDVTLTGVQTLINKNLTSGTNTFPTFNQNTTGSAATLTTPRNINGVSFNGSADITVTSAAGTLTGTTLNSSVITSSLTSVGTIGTGIWQGSVIGSTYGGTGINNGGRTLTLNTNSGTLVYSLTSSTLTVAATGSISGTNTGDQDLSGLAVKVNNLSDLTNPSTAITNLGGTSVGESFFTLTNPSAVTFPRINADNSVTAQTAINFKIDLGIAADIGAQINDSLNANQYYIDTTQSNSVYKQFRVTSPNHIKFREWYAGSNISFVLTGDSIQINSTGGGGSMAIGSPITSGTSSRILFAGSGGYLQQKDGFNFDSTNIRLGIGITAPAVTLHALSTTEQLRLGYDASNYMSTTVTSGGDASIALTGGTTLTLSPLVVVSGGFKTNSTSTSANFNVPTSASIGTTTSAVSLQIGGGTAVQYRASMRGSTSSTLTVDNSYSGFVIGQLGATEAASGTHPLISSLAIRAPVVTNGAGATTNMATLWISGEPTGVTPTGGAYSFYDSSGTAYIGGDLQLPSRTYQNDSTTYKPLVINTTTGTVYRSSWVVGGAGGGLTSVGLVMGTAGTDLGVTGSPLTSNGDMTLNVPDASATARGVVTTGSQTFAGTKTFSSSPVNSGGLQTNSTSGNSNFVVYGGASASTSVTGSQWLFAGATAVKFRAGVYGATSSTLTAADSYSSFIIGNSPITEGTSGTHALLASAVIRPINVTGGSATTTETASLYIEDAASIGTNNYSLHIDAGLTKLDGGLNLDPTNTAGGTTGNQTINKPSGTVNIAAAGNTVTVTNSFVTTSSIVYAVVRTNDATATIKNVVPGSGSFVITMTANVTAETSIGWAVIN